MADTQFLDGDAEGMGLLRIQQIINLTGAAVSVALVVGVVMWGYRLAVRDVAGIPVLQALDEPMRIAPADPGGKIGGHIGLSVNAIAAEGGVAPPPNQLVLAPRPVDLTAEDQPFAAAPLTPTDPAAALPGSADGRIDVLAPVEMPTRTVQASPADPSDALAPDPAADTVLDSAIKAEPLSEPAGLDDPAAEGPVIDLELETAPQGTLVRSLRPMRRPTETVVLAALSTSGAEPVQAAAVTPARIEAGTRLVQLGAFDDEADAVAEWARLVAQFGDLIAGKSRVIQDAQSGGRNFVRLRAMGFADEADARRFCSALLSENAACIPVAQR